ncbi:MAG: bifunctional nuclease family protein [Actinomycetia bacterium]|nr:bifunctional nuclease family protein [Actinomycetes bacterium]MCP3912097.1 bifunctional nuclease family protein [Actinomycetes bacterium]MCP4086400.1 bifunctional nuclease family protein [Actinomycetes bacterium]
MVPMELIGVKVQMPANSPIVVLREESGRNRILPIFIGGAEAQAIAYALEGVEPPRPMTHDLLKIMLEELGATVHQIQVTELRDGTFYAEITVWHAGTTSSVSARPSDAIALAARLGTPIFAAEGVLDEAGHVEEVDEEGDESGDDPDEMVEQFREFIDNVNPDDFAS